MMERAPTSFVEAFYYQVWNTDEEAAAREILNGGLPLRGIAQSERHSAIINLLYMT